MLLTHLITRVPVSQRGTFSEKFTFIGLQAERDTINFLAWFVYESGLYNILLPSGFLYLKPKSGLPSSCTCSQKQNHV